MELSLVRMALASVLARVVPLPLLPALALPVVVVVLLLVLSVLGVSDELIELPTLQEPLPLPSFQMQVLPQSRLLISRPSSVAPVMLKVYCAAVPAVAALPPEAAVALATVMEASLVTARLVQAATPAGPVTVQVDCGVPVLGVVQLMS